MTNTNEIYGPKLEGPPDWEAPATVGQFVPGIETIDDIYTATSGCGLLCRAGGEDPVGWGWRAVSGAALVAPVGGAMVRNLVEPAFDFLRHSGDEIVEGVVNLLRRGCANSFSADTLVMTDDGPLPIGEIVEGELVLAYNEATGEIGYYPVVALISHVDMQVVYLTIEGEVVITTPEHPFYTSEGEWVDAAELEVGDEIRTAAWTTGTVETVYTVTQPQQMYNFTVGIAHTYFVGDSSWLVHNCPDTQQLKNIISKYPLGNYCERCAQEVYDLFKKSGVDAHIGHMETDLPFITLKDGTRVNNNPTNTFHEFVLANGRVYDAITGADGMPLDDYKKLFYDGVFDDGTLRLSYSSP